MGHPVHRRENPLSAPGKQRALFVYPRDVRVQLLTPGQILAGPQIRLQAVPLGGQARQFLGGLRLLVPYQPQLLLLGVERGPLTVAATHRAQRPLVHGPHRRERVLGERHATQARLLQ
ncbi:hypothetical protein ACIP5L_28105 [Streptomyces bacillaris]|uniref:hypothetical protein n=1 Tax=Streptomyces bacillaris TaxID=68179 RepID=UPI003806358A